MLTAVRDIGVIPYPPGEVSRKQGTDSLAWGYWRVQGAGDALWGTTCSCMILICWCKLLANCTYLSQKPLVHMQVIEIMVGQIIPLAAQIAIGPS